MADEFTNVEGLKVSRAEIVQRKIDYYKAAFGEGNTQITDFNEGSEARNFLEACSIDAYELRFWIDFMMRQSFPQYAVRGYLDMIGVMVNCYRQPAVKATGSITFTTDGVKSYNIIIPKGTLGKTGGSDGIYFVTTEQATLTAGNLSVNVDIEAVIAGVSGIVNANTINELPNPIDDLTVNNSSSTVNGKDAESDASFSARIIEAGKGGSLGSVHWYKSMAENISDVHDAYVINNPEGEEYNVKILVNGDTRPTPTEVLNNVIALFKLPENDIAGINVIIDKPNYVTQNIEATITLKEGYVWNTVKAAIESNIACYFNSGTPSYTEEEFLGLNTGADIIKSQLQLIIVNTEGVLDYNLTTPAENVIIADNEAAKLGTTTLTQV